MNPVDTRLGDSASPACPQCRSTSAVRVLSHRADGSPMFVCTAHPKPLPLYPGASRPLSLREETEEEPEDAPTPRPALRPVSTPRTASGPTRKARAPQRAAHPATLFPSTDA